MYLLISFTPTSPVTHPTQHEMLQPQHPHPPTPTPTPSTTSQPPRGTLPPDFRVGELKAINNNTASLLTITGLQCDISGLSLMITGTICSPNFLLVFIFPMFFNSYLILYIVHLAIFEYPLVCLAKFY